MRVFLMILGVKPKGKEVLMVAKLDIDLKKEYFNYLTNLVCDKKHHKVDYIPLLDNLFGMKFLAILDRDENRIADGDGLRKEFVNENDVDEAYLYEFDDIDVSVLEVLIGIARRMEYQIGNGMDDDHTNERFWLLLANLGIEKYSADNYKPLNIREKVDIWMKRKFKKDGSGSIFPLQKPAEDQRKCEIWIQMTRYIWENWFENE